MQLLHYHTKSIAVQLRIKQSQKNNEKSPKLDSRDFYGFLHKVLKRMTKYF